MKSEIINNENEMAWRNGCEMAKSYNREKKSVMAM